MMIRRLSSPRTTLALLAALVTTLAGQTAAPADDDPGAYEGPAIGAHALRDRTWDAPLQAWTGATSPSATVPADPATDKPGYYTDKDATGRYCHAKHGQTAPADAAACAYGTKTGSTTWMLVGNSKSATYQPLLDSIAAREGASLRVATKSSHPFTPGVGTGEGREYSDAVLAQVTKTRPAVVYLVASAGQVDYTDRLGAITDRLLDAGAGRVIYLWDTPDLAESPLTKKARSIAASRPQVEYVSVGDWVCQGSDCPAAIGGITVRGAGSHLTDTYARTLANPLHADLHDAGVTQTDPDTVDRKGGVDRYATSATLSYGDGDPQTWQVYVATGLDYPDALAAAALTGTATKLVLTRPGSLPSPVRAACGWLYCSYAQAVVLGGTDAVSQVVETELGQLYEGVTRTSGQDRYETAAEIARQSPYPTKRVFLASGTAWPDAVTAAAVSDPADGDVVLLTHRDHLSLATRAYLAETKPGEVVVVGGQSAVSGAVLSQARKAAAGASVSRVAGLDRYETAARAVRAYASDSTRVYVATGTDWPDALAAGQEDGATVLLTRPGNLPAETAAAIRAIDPDRVTVVGGYLAVSTTVEDQLRLTVR